MVPRLPIREKLVKLDGYEDRRNPKKLLHAQTFRAFAIHVADGGRIPVKHEDFAALAPTGREMIVYHQVVNVLLVTRLQVPTRNGGNRKHK